MQLATTWSLVVLFGTETFCMNITWQADDVYMTRTWRTQNPGVVVLIKNLAWRVHDGIMTRTWREHDGCMTGHTQSIKKWKNGTKTHDGHITHAKPWGTPHKKLGMTSAWRYNDEDMTWAWRVHDGSHPKHQKMKKSYKNTWRAHNARKPWVTPHKKTWHDECMTV